MKKLSKATDLTRDHANANKHTLRGMSMLEDSLQRYGAGRGVCADKNGALIAGSATVETWQQMGGSIRVVETDGTELVVVQRRDLDLAKDPRARQLAVADNRVGEVDLDWDPEALQALIDGGVSLEPFFGQADIDKLRAELEGMVPDVGGGREASSITCPHCGAVIER